jgi:U2 small nuclear ribonucleoprotein A'
MINVKTLLMGNNRICKIEKDLSSYLPNLRVLILTNNMIENLGDLEPLMDLANLQELSLLNNPVTEKEHYRHYIVHKCPKLRILDFRKVKEKVVSFLYVGFLTFLIPRNVMRLPNYSAGKKGPL